MNSVVTIDATGQWHLDGESDCWRGVATGRFPDLANPVPAADVRPGDPLTIQSWMADARQLANAGVDLVIGTDMTSVVDTDHGEETILEIEAFVEIGFSPLAAINAAWDRVARERGLA